MPSVDCAAPALFARNIAAYSDAELDCYLEQNGRFVDVEDPENLPEDFIRRLKDRTQGKGTATESRPVDPDRLALALQQCAAREPSPSIGTTPSPSCFDEEEEYQNDVQYETKCYHALVEAGGRPSHPLSCLEDIIKDPGNYREILSFWQGEFAKEDEWRVFSIQLKWWQDFQRLQRYARVQNGYDYWRSEWEDECRRHRLKYGDDPRNRTYLGGGVYAGTEAAWEHRWQRYKKYNDKRTVHARGFTPWWSLVQRKGRPIEEQGFPEYALALKERLTKHGFTRAFQLNEDLARQDKVTTWIEYLGYVYWWYDQYAISERGQQRHDEAWKRLVDSSVLKPGETEENLWGLQAGLRAAGEEEEAEKAVQAAMLVVASAERAVSKSHKSRLTAEQLQHRLLTAQSTLEVAMKRQESVKRRNSLISEFRHQTRVFQINKGHAEQHQKLLHWVLQQLPLVEVELSASNVARNGSDRRDSRSKRKRLEEPDNEPTFPKRRRDDGDRDSMLDRKLRIVSTSQGDGRRKPRADTALEDEQSFKRHKNNGRNLGPCHAKISGRSASDSSVAREIEKPDPSDNAVRLSNATVKSGNPSPDGSSPIPRTLRRSARLAKRVNTTNIR